MKYSNKSINAGKNNKTNTKKEEKSDFISNDFLAPCSNVLGYLLTALAFVMALFVFVPDVSVGGDDSTYLQSAYNFAEGIAFPTWQGPVYPMLIGSISKIFGFHIILFKFLSVIFFAISVYLTHRLFSRFANAFAAVSVSAISAVCYMLLLYASSTYTEPFFMMLQSGFLLYLLEIMQREPAWSAPGNRSMWRKYFIHFGLLALAGYVMFQTRSLAIVVIPLTIAYLVLSRKYKPAAVFAGAAVLCHIVNTVYRRLFWDVESVSFRSQLDSIMLINPYEPSKGYETLGGYLGRFWDNSMLYLSKHFMKMFGLFDYDARVVSTSITVFMLLLLLSAGIYLWKRNRNLFVVYGYSVAMMGVTFVMLQKLWDQERLVMIYFPLVLGQLIYILYNVCSKAVAVPVLIAGLIFTANLVRTIGRADTNLASHFDSGTYRSYTDDWRNYMLASRWASDSLPKGSVVICRKSQMSWIAADGANNVKFQGLYKLHTFDSDSMCGMLLDTLQGTHAILANLRLNPYEPNGKTITTMRNSLRVMMTNHLGKVKFIKQFGDREPAYLLEFARDGQPDASSFQAALVVEPASPVVWRDLTLLYLRENQPGKARRAIEEALRLNRGNPDVEPELHFVEAIVHFEAQDFEKALACFGQALQGRPENFDAQFNIAVSLYNLHRFSEALDAVIKARELGAQEQAVAPLEAAIRAQLRHQNP